MNTLLNVLTQLEQEGAALGHFNVADLVLLKAVLPTARENTAPEIVGASEGERDFLGTRHLAAVVKSLRKQSNLPVFLNADHTHSLARAKELDPQSKTEFQAMHLQRARSGIRTAGILIAGLTGGPARLGQLAGSCPYAELLPLAGRRKPDEWKLLELYRYGCGA